MPKKRLKRVRPKEPPLRFEQEYERRLMIILNDYYKIVDEVIITNLQSVYQEADQQLGTTRRDDFSDTVERMVETLRIRSNPLFNDAKARALALDIGQKVSSWNLGQWQETLRRVLGVDLFRQEAWLSPLLNSFAKDNVNLIKSIQGQSIEAIDQLVVNGIKDGERWEITAKKIAQRVKTEDIKPRYRKDANRVAFIARDQVSKLNGQLTKQRQEAVGISKYLWRTSLDERVRPSHRRKESRVFSWDNPPPDTGHPGQDFRCRCVAEPIFDKAFLAENGLTEEYFPTTVPARKK